MRRRVCSAASARWRCSYFRVPTARTLTFHLTVRLVKFTLSDEEATVSDGRAGGTEMGRAMDTGSERPGRQVLVVGAGIGGPALAFWLHRAGFAITVVERAPRLRPGGQAVDLRGIAREVA